MRSPAFCFSLCLCLLLCLARPAFAQEPAPNAGDEPAKKNLVPFREDSGLITAEYYISTGKYAQALNVLQGVLKRHPESADAFTYTGYAYYKLGDVKKATSYYKKALIVNPTHLGANRYMAEIYLSVNDLARAIEQMQVIRMTCAEADCEELDEIEAEINAYKNGQHDEPAPADAPKKNKYN